MSKILISPSFIIPVTKEETILENYSILIKNNKIINIVPTTDKHKLHFDKEFILKDQVVIPGLINLHGHSAMFLLRGKADDLVLNDWLENYIWPMEKEFVNEEFVYDGTILAMAEMIKSGTTTINDMYFYHGEVAKAAIDTKMRTFIGCSILEFPTNYANNAQEYINKALNNIEKFNNEELISFTLAAHAPYSVSDSTFKKIIDIAKKEDLLVHSHIHETKKEIDDSIKQYNISPLFRLEKLGFLDTKLIAAHMVHLTNEEINLCKEYNIGIAHNPSSNMKLASGIIRAQDLLNKNINLGIGTDGAASNNKLDMLSEMRLASLIAKGFNLDPTSLKAYDVLKMATINGAKALHIDHLIGSIEEGKLADLISIDLSSLETSPNYNIISNIIYSAGRENISNVWINGKIVLQNKKLMTISDEKINETIKKWNNKISRFKINTNK